MSSIPAAKDRLAQAGHFINTALPPHLAWVQEDVETILAELSRLEEENERLREDNESLLQRHGIACDEWAKADEENAKLRAEHDEALEIVKETAALQSIDGGRSFPSKELCERAASLITKGGADV